jgi:beta-barrel assembly-enhancing protease
VRRARSIILFVFISIFGWTSTIEAQENCPLPTVLSTEVGPNIFSPQQEIDLGDAIADRMPFRLRATDDIKLTAYLDRIGEQLVRQLPPTGLRFRYFLVDAAMPDALSLPGGRIYVSRKMAIFAGNEEEIASVLAHEIGHIVTHQSAVDVTRLLQEVRGVTQVSDRNDVFEKFNALMEGWRRNPQAFREVQKKGQSEQLSADEVALYTLARAGYSPQSFITFFDRLAQTKGLTGSWISDFFRVTKPSELRLREMLKFSKDMSHICVDSQVTFDNSEFKKWQAEVIGFSGWVNHKEENLHGVLEKIDLEPRLGVSPDLNQLRFSPDGRYLLAQGFGKINVLTLDPFAYLFQIDAWVAQPAQFTPDSKSIVFSTSNLRVEVWDVVSQKRVNAYEPVFLHGCESSLLAPDGKTLACSSADDALVLVDLSSGETIFHKKSFHRRGFGGMHMSFSPDARYFAAANDDGTIAFDMREKSMVRLRGELSSETALSGGFAFLSSNRLIGRDGHDLHVSLMDFPSGKVSGNLSIKFGAFQSPGHGDYLILTGGAEKYAAAVVNLQSQKIIIADKQRACDIYDDIFVTQTVDGAVSLYDAKTLVSKGRLNLPGGTLHSTAAVVSADLKWLAVSKKDQGAVWDLTNGKRVYDLQQFNGGWFSGDGWFLVDFPRTEKTPHEIGQLSLSGQPPVAGLRIEDKYVRQEGRFLLVTRPKITGGILNEESGDLLSVVSGIARAFDPCRSKFPDFDRFDCDVTQEVRDVRSGQTLWSRRFPKEVPRFRFLPNRSRVLLTWRATANAAGEEIRKYPELAEEFNSIKDKTGFQLLEVLDASDGNVLSASLLNASQVAWDIAERPERDPSLILSHGKTTIIQSMTRGLEEGRVSGRPLALSADGSLLAVANENDGLAVHKLGSLQECEEFTFPDRILLAQFSQGGKKLFVLTDSQTAYVLEVSLR